MTTKQMESFTKHIDTFLNQSDSSVIHPLFELDPHIDILLYRPTDTYPFWKMVTMGASDYKMPPLKNTIANYNEYIMLVDKDVNMADKETYAWYAEKLWKIAYYPVLTKTHVTYGHSFEWEKDEPDDEMIAAFLEFPQAFDYGILFYKAGFFKKIACLQVILLNESDLDKLKRIGSQAYSEYLYPDDKNAPRHFLCERKRSDKF